MAHGTCETIPTNEVIINKSLKGKVLPKSIVCFVLAVIALAMVSQAAELPDSPGSLMGAGAPMVKVAVPPAVTAPKITRVRPMDKKFLGLAVISTGSTFADSYTTLFARENWLAHKQGVCNVEVQSAYLYGTHPTVGRAYAVASVKSAGAIFSAYYLRKHHSRFWAAPFAANSIISMEGVTQNMIECN